MNKDRPDIVKKDSTVFSRASTALGIVCLGCVLSFSAVAQTPPRAAQSLEELEERLSALTAREQEINQRQSAQQRSSQSSDATDPSATAPAYHTDILDEPETQMVRPGGDTYILDQEESGTGDMDILDSPAAAADASASTVQAPLTQSTDQATPPAQKDNTLIIIVLAVCFGGAFLLIIGALIIWLKPSLPKRAAPARQPEGDSLPEPASAFNKPVVSASERQEIPPLETLNPLSENEAPQSAEEILPAILEESAFPDMPAQMNDEFSSPLIDESDIHTQVLSTLSQANWLINEGNLDKARDTLEEHMVRLPNSQRLIMKLLEVHKLSDNIDAFNTLAGTFRELLQDQYQDWKQVIEWGAALDPHNPLYHSSGATLAAIQSAAQPVSPPPAFEENDANIYAAPSTPPRAALPTKDDPFAGIPMQDNESPEMTFDQGLAAMREEMEKITGVPSPLPDTLNDPWTGEDDEEGNDDDPFFDFDAPTTPEATRHPPFAGGDVDILENEPALSVDPFDAPAFQPQPMVEEMPPEKEAPIAQVPGMTPGDTSSASTTPATMPLTLSPNLDETMKVHFREIDSRLALVTAYENMGDMTGARELLQEIVNTAKIPEQRAVAMEKLQDLGR